MVASKIISALTPKGGGSIPPDQSSRPGTVSDAVSSPVRGITAQGPSSTGAGIDAARVTPSHADDTRSPADAPASAPAPVSDGDGLWSLVSGARTAVSGFASAASNDAAARAAGLVSSLYAGGDAGSEWAAAAAAAAAAIEESEGKEVGTLISPARGTPLEGDSSVLSPTPRPPSKRRASVSSELRWLVKNPYNYGVGKDEYTGTETSTSAVRALLNIVPEAQGGPGGIAGTGMGERRFNRVRFALDDISEEDMPKSGRSESSGSRASMKEDEASSDAHTPSGGGKLADSFMSTSSADGYPGEKRRQATDAEMASRLAAGTIRALRDLALDEAAELQSCLRFWTERWENPALGWLEAGPTVWFSEGGYDHRAVGRKVSQIQAVLARRCASVGELQTHLLRAGWQSGVAQWGVLGQGQWAAVAGGDGAMDDNGASNFAASVSDPQVSPVADSAEVESDVGSNQVHRQPNHQSNFIGKRIIRAALGSGKEKKEQKSRPDYHGTASVSVCNTRGGTIQTDDAAVAAWSVDAMRVVRDQLYRAGDGTGPLPYFENWVEEEHYFHGNGAKQGVREMNKAQGEPINWGEEAAYLPLWATEDVGAPESFPASGELEDGGEVAGADKLDQIEIQGLSSGHIVISDLSLMAAEVSEVLSSMEVQIETQRQRRLERLRPMPKLRRGWYGLAFCTPLVGYVGYRLVTDRLGIQLLWKEVIGKVGEFYAEHIADPVQSIYKELFTKKGREDVTDREARVNAIKSLQNMIKSWLDETYPDPAMSESERIERGRAMDMSLIEEKKEKSIRQIYEINNIVWMSLIEMQFIKKELMNALCSMDELMGSNEINMKVAAMTPAFILMYGIRSLGRYFRYALLKLGKSKEETFAHFRTIVLDIERLLVMRDNPPSAPPPLMWGAANANKNSMAPISVDPSSSTAAGPYGDLGRSTILNAEDLGMLMLLVHECRTILWENRRRFSPAVVRNVSEDLAELVGERGSVSVQQQLQIVGRMCRTYSFLKVLSTGLPFKLVRRSG